jgi:hypothetical protein
MPSDIAGEARRRPLESKALVCLRSRRRSYHFFVRR